MRLLIDAKRFADADTVINEIARTVPWKGGAAAWFSGIAVLAHGDHYRLAEFRSVYVRCRASWTSSRSRRRRRRSSAGDTAGAADCMIVSATDPGFTGAVFGLARCRVAMGDVDGAIVVVRPDPQDVELVR